MLTRGGGGVALIAACLAVAGRVFGFLELTLLAAGLAVVLLLALVFVRLRRIKLELRRAVTPTRVNAGDPARVDLQITALGRSRTPVLELYDRVTGTRGATINVAPMPPGETARASYSLPTERRGIVEVGPLTLTVTDPFGVARSTTQAAGVSRLVVYPRIHPIPPAPHTSGRQPVPGVDRAARVAAGGDDFHALRPYVFGDDLRRVHWRSTARHDQLMVRQDQLPQQGRLTVVLDVDADTMSAPALDEAVSVAASVLAANRRRGDLVRLVTPDGTDSGFVGEQTQLHAILEYLAVVQPQRGTRLVDALERLAGPEQRSAVVTVTGELDHTGRRMLDLLAPSVGPIASVVLHRSYWDPAWPAVEPVASWRWILLARGASFPELWAAALSERANPVGASR